MAISRAFWQKVQNSIWLMCGLLCFFFALAFWAISDQKEQLQIIKQAEEETEVQIQPEKVAATTLGMLQDEVKPLTLTTRIASSGTHEAEFRGTKFITENKTNSTIELFRAADESVVKDFIKKQQDPTAFYYIRLSGEKLKEQYAVIYGIYRNADFATTALEDLKINLPRTVKPQVIRFEKYIPFVNDLGSEEQGLTGKLREVNLKPVIVVQKPNPPVEVNRTTAPSNLTEPGTTTTITRQNATENSVDVQHSTVAP